MLQFAPVLADRTTQPEIWSQVVWTSVYYYAQVIPASLPLAVLSRCLPFSLWGFFIYGTVHLF